MKQERCSARRTLTSWLACLALLTPATGNGLSQEPAQPAPKGPPRPLGARSCVSCHSRSRVDETGRVELLESLLPRDFCIQHEAELFFKYDKHAKSYEAIAAKGGLGEKICEALGIKDVGAAQECRSCHGGYALDPDELPAKLEYGVSCEECHGPSSIWKGEHDAISWRTKTPVAKEALGMFDVRNPARRAEICYSCHIGDATQGKVVTHAMYAAGHPPLPGVEIETFAAAMPSHWRTLREKGDFLKRDEYVAANLGLKNGDALAGELPRSRAVVVGGLVAMKTYLTLFVEQAHKPDPWPELAVFDCQACHHDLRSPSWRQPRMRKGAPGRPLLLEWPKALVRVSERLDPGLGAFDPELTDLWGLLDAQPFGDQGKVRDLGPGKFRALAWLDKAASDLSKIPFDDAKAAAALEELFRTGSAETLDYHSARQIAWGIRAIQLERKAKYPNVAKRSADETRTERTARDAGDIREFETWTATTLKTERGMLDKLFAEKAQPRPSLSELLVLDLPAGQRRPQPGIDEYQEFYQRYLLAIGAYDPAWFREGLEALSRTPEFADVARPARAGTKVARPD